MRDPTDWPNATRTIRLTDSYHIGRIVPIDEITYSHRIYLPLHDRVSVKEEDQMA